ncbi:MAG: DinB family protein [Planctomycetaceae bacterium]
MSAASDADADWPAILKAEWIHLLNQSLARIRHCVAQLDESQLWWRPAEDLNSVGNLLLHVTGNLQQWAVDGILRRSSQRQRQQEFLADGTHSGEQLLHELRRVVAAAVSVISETGVAELSADRSIQGFQTTVLGALMHTVSHLVGHTHQIVLLTRMQLGTGYRYHWTPEMPRTGVPL